jgi:threonyl-tRNA synthetase
MMAEEKDLALEAERHIPEGYDPDLYRIRHSAAHVLAQAVTERFPGARAAIGPPVEDGFYYDFELPRRPTEEDQAWVEERMKEIAKGRHPFTVREVSADEAREIFRDQPFKLELIDGLAQGEGGEGERITLYQQDTFVDLCRGPHVRHTGYIQPNAIKLMSVSGSYWRGDEKRESLYRFYGTAWRNKTELTAYLERLEEAKRRDHRKLGRELELFTTSDLVGAGFPLWLPNGSVIRRELEQFILHEERLGGYQHVYTPVLAKKQLFEISGHWQHYSENIFPPIQLDNEELVLRPMNCPHHILTFASKPRSYRDLPVRLAELGMMHRYERSGVVGGLTRVRAMTLNDAHIFCTPEQVPDEFAKVVRLVQSTYSTLGITEYGFRLSAHDPSSDKYVDNAGMWARAEAQLRTALQEMGTPFTEAAGEAAFYGPKVDIQVRDVLGREETISTIQLDFHLPGQFGITYTGEDNQQHTPVMIHRGVISTLERMTAYLIELYAGAFPAWLAPVQAVVLPIADRHSEYAESVARPLFADDLRVEVDASSKPLNARIRDAQLQKVPYILVAGDREVENGTVAVRLRTGETLPPMPAAEFHELLRRKVRERSLTLVD